MMDFFTIPLVVGIICAGIYGLFELFARRKERLAIIDKLADKMDSSNIDGKLVLPNFGIRLSFNSLKIGCLMAGVGLGLLVAFVLNTTVILPNYQSYDQWIGREVIGAVYGASVLLFGGIGLLIAFLIELKISKSNKEN